MWKYLGLAGGIVLILWTLAPRNSSPSDLDGDFFTKDRTINLFVNHPEPVLKQKYFQLFVDKNGDEYFTNINRNRSAIDVQPLNGDEYFTIRPHSLSKDNFSKSAINLLFSYKIVSWDSIYVLDKTGVSIYMCNKKGNITSVWTVTETLCNNGPFYLRGYPFSPLQIQNNALYASFFSYPPSSRQSDIFSCNTIAKVDLPSGGGQTTVSAIFGPYSSVYKNPAIGYGVIGYIPSFVSITDRPGRSFVLSFPKDHQMYRVNETKTVKAISAQSSYIKRFTPYAGNLRDRRYNEKYETEEPRYWQVIRDPFRNLYYRVVLHHQTYEDDVRVRQFHEKPWSIMVFDKNFRKLGEQKFPPKKFFPKDIFVGKDGLYISNATVKHAGVTSKTSSFTLFKVSPPAL